MQPFSNTTVTFSHIQKEAFISLKVGLDLYSPY